MFTSLIRRPKQNHSGEFLEKYVVYIHWMLKENRRIVAAVSLSVADSKKKI